jgi:hypothetical protein
MELLSAPSWSLVAAQWHSGACQSGEGLNYATVSMGKPLSTQAIREIFSST